MLASAQNEIKLTADLYEEIQKEADVTAEELEILTLKTSFYYVEFTDLSGGDLNNEGKTADASSREYFQEAVKEQLKEALLAGQEYEFQYEGGYDIIKNCIIDLVDDGEERERLKSLLERGQLQQIFTNILENAVKFTPEGGRICFGIRERPSGMRGCVCYEFTFEDTGIAGLGMSIVKNLVKMMNGEIQVESKLNEGTKFTVTVYLKINRYKQEDLKSIPILAMSADVFMDDIKHARDVGMNGHVAKPIDINDLLKALEEWIK